MTNSTLHRFTLPANVDGGGSITLRELTVEEVFTIEARSFASAKSEADLATAGASSARDKHIAAITFRNDKVVSGTEREEVYHRLGARGVSMLRAAYRVIHEGDEADLADFLATRADA